MESERAHQQPGEASRPSLREYLSPAELERLAAALVEMLMSADEQRRRRPTTESGRAQRQRSVVDGVA